MTRPPAPKWWLQLGGVAVALLALPYLMPGGSLDLNPLAFNRLPFHAGFVDLATTVLAFSLFALGFNLLFGHGGELSFGHAMFFAIGSYATALYTKGFDVAMAEGGPAPGLDLAFGHGAIYGKGSDGRNPKRGRRYPGPNGAAPETLFDGLTAARPWTDGAQPKEIHQEA